MEAWLKPAESLEAKLEFALEERDSLRPRPLSAILISYARGETPSCITFAHLFGNPNPGKIILLILFGPNNSAVLEALLF